jgi:hypothetical protein
MWNIARGLWACKAQETLENEGDPAWPDNLPPRQVTVEPSVLGGDHRPVKVVLGKLNDELLINLAIRAGCPGSFRRPAVNHAAIL